MTLMMAAVMALTAMSQTNSIFIEDFEICPDSVALVPVLLANDDATRGLQFNMTLPPGLDVARCKLTDRSLDLDMTVLFDRDRQSRSCTVIIYSHKASSFDPGRDAVATLTIKASSDFRGGDIKLWKLRGSTLQNQSIIMEDTHCVVSVPQSALVGVPIDMQQEAEQHFAPF